MSSNIKRISIKTVFGNIDVEKIPEKGAKKLIKIVGLVTGFHVGKSMLGDLVVLKGSFFGLNLETGQEVFSSKCLVPENLTDEISVLLAGKGVSSLEFGVVISAQRSPSLAKGYEFVIVHLIKMAKSEPLASLMARIPAMESFSPPNKPDKPYPPGPAPSKKKAVVKKAAVKKKAKA
jgi:hypothetical protein